MKTNLSAVKMSKRARKALDAQARGDWNGVVPVTRVVPDKKAYDRRRTRRAREAVPLPPGRRRKPPPSSIPG